VRLRGAVEEWGGVWELRRGFEGGEKKMRTWISLIENIYIYIYIYIIKVDKYSKSLMFNGFEKLAS